MAARAPGEMLSPVMIHSSVWSFDACSVLCVLCKCVGKFPAHACVCHPETKRYNEQLPMITSLQCIVLAVRRTLRSGQLHKARFHRPAAILMRQKDLILNLRTPIQPTFT
ncbi:uncharacterized protein BP01DRAFT_13740 [Aspergillus saccharolyticus JOP 1030-1]|uniref:Uncharacterized protein n=1 Tax=Aspergillus saccharolyticus JOP 1030-1 TaxID=1450539 RepID=A0A318ZTS0_9EURO|nr:hypothetical protein BP01DRAFT_13740 [Aspergillus saccharolyticus JOP 1030-1]PYH50074.1 hypothetical protein BP01DRAFT_13740 [Aspergillus saccharolyticus JOP 1030-1]